MKMVIACPECSTKFRVNPERIPDKGAKVRCARCKHIFLVQNEPPPEPAAAVDETPAREPAVVPPAEPEKSSTIQQAIEPPLEPGQPVASEEDFSSRSNDLSADAAESDFSYEEFLKADASRKDEDFTFSSEEPAEKEVETESEDFSFGEDPAALAAELNQLPEETEEKIAQGAGDVAPPPPPEVELDLAAGDPVEPAVPEAPKSVMKTQKSGPLGSVIRVLLLLFFGLLVLGGVLYYMNGPEHFEQAIQQLLGMQEEQPVQTGQIALDQLEGKFVSNQDAGELFVIRGQAINQYQQARASIQVKGVIFDPNGKALLQKTIFCGNPISDDELETLPFAKLEELMGNQFGKSLSNMNVATDQAIPFAIVFRDLPQNLAEFSVTVAGSQPATQ